MSIFQKLKNSNKDPYAKFQQEFNQILEKATSDKAPKNAKAIVAKFLERKEILTSRYSEAIRKELATNLSMEERFEQRNNMLKQAEQKINYQCQNELEPNERAIFESYMNSLKTKIISLVAKYSTDEFTASQLLDYLSTQLRSIKPKKEYFSRCLHQTSKPQVDESINPLDILNRLNNTHIPSEEEARSELINCAIKEEIISICLSIVSDKQKNLSVGRKDKRFF